MLSKYLCGGDYRVERRDMSVSVRWLVKRKKASKLVKILMVGSHIVLYFFLLCVSMFSPNGVEGATKREKGIIA